jgi:hypothetical protein
MQIKALQTLHELGGEYMDAAEHRSLMQEQLKQLSKPPVPITAADIDADVNASSDNTSIDEVQVVDKLASKQASSIKTTKSIQSKLVQSPTTTPLPEKTPPPCHYCHVKVAYLCHKCESRSICHRCSSERCGNESMKRSDAICEACFTVTN